MSRLIEVERRRAEVKTRPASRVSWRTKPSPTEQAQAAIRASDAKDKLLREFETLREHLLMIAAETRRAEAHLLKQASLSATVMGNARLWGQDVRKQIRRIELTIPKVRRAHGIVEGPSRNFTEFIAPVLTRVFPRLLHQRLNGRLIAKLFRGRPSR